MKAKKIIILGTGGNCIDILEIINDINKFHNRQIYKCIGFLDDDITKENTYINNLPILGTLKDAINFKDCYFINGIGSPNTFKQKKDIINSCNISINRFLSLIHPKAYISDSAKIGFGCVVFPNVSIHSNVTIKDHIIILSNTVINHDCVVDSFSCITSGCCLCGNVHIGKSCYIGSNSSIINNITLNDKCLIGIGSVVLKNCDENSKYVGNPSKKID